MLDLLRYAESVDPDVSALDAVTKRVQPWPLCLYLESNSNLALQTDSRQSTTMGRSTEFVTGHHDRVTVLHTNFNGTRILTASIDHRIKVWQRDPKTGERTLIDTFTAHDADIRDVGAP